MPWEYEITMNSIPVDISIIICLTNSRNLFVKIAVE